MTLIQTINELQKWKLNGSAPPREYRMHPDDLEEFRRQMRREIATYPCENNGDWLMGIRIIPDADAPRLPRR